MKNKKILINSKDTNYNIYVGSNLIAQINKILKKDKINAKNFLIIYDSKVPFKIINTLRKKIKENIIFHKFYSSEKNKNQKSVNKILNIMLKNNFNRNDCLIAVGGGIIGDVSAFAASIFKRGLKFINIPTTLLAQVDSSIGGKTGINSDYGKNLIGSFYQPDLVIADIKFLKYLPKRELICGYAEIFKHSIISDKKFFYFLLNNFEKIISLKKPYIDRAIYKSCLIKKKIVEKDVKEKNLRKTLNLGHTFAHSYEASYKYSKGLNHGEAVLLGINSASEFSFKKNLLNYKEYKLIINHISKINNSLKINNYFNKKDTNKLLGYIKNDKKNISKKINLILINKIGKVSYNNFFELKEISKFIRNQFL
ncbi:MAG: 3-dehydroquinate synthase [Candidatus Pelagibacterales bacterium]|nr:MAG: 3-dehydroquinate synthase [Pelagibacterales bacterium]